MHWYEIRDPNDPELDRLAAQFHLHPLHIEDCRHRNQRAKVEENGTYLFTVLKPVSVAGDGSVEAGDLDIFLGADFLITVEESGCEHVRKTLAQIAATASDQRADQLFYRIVDTIVDSYLPALDHFDDVIDDLQDAILEKASPEALARIFETKRSLILLRRVLVNTRDVAGHLQRTEAASIGRDLWPFLRDIYDHVSRNLDMVDSLRDLLTGSLDVYLSTVANRTNEVMKTLTYLGTIALPVLVITGFYGMNVRDLPFTNTPHGAAILTVVIVTITAALAALLRLFHWF